MKRLATFAMVVLTGSVGLTAEPDADAVAANKRLGRGMNLGNALEAPQEGAWGVKLEADYFAKIKEAGFDSVRIPIRWSAHAGKEAPYEIDPEFCKRIDWAIDHALTNQLAVIVNVHHYDEMFNEPAKALPRLIGLWKQIAPRYKDRPATVYFELLNEPHNKLTDDIWNDALPRLLAVVRETNPRRWVIVGPGHWNNLGNLDKLKLPEDDRYLIATFHYYSPFEFTHQGAPFQQGADKWKGRTWRATEAEKAALARDFDKAAAWAKKNKRPLFLGEFGTYHVADAESRATWTRTVAREAEQRGFSWAYWEFCSGFGVFDAKTKSWNEPLRNALVNKP